MENRGWRARLDTCLVSHVSIPTPVSVTPLLPSVPVGVPLGLPTLSQMSCLGTQHSQLPVSDTQLHSQASLLAERREANTSCSLHCEIQPVKEEPEESKFRVPQPPPAASLSVLQGVWDCVSIHRMNSSCECVVLFYRVTATGMHRYVVCTCCAQ